MTTPILEPLLAVTAAMPVGAQRETPIDSRAFRDVLAPPPQRPVDAPTTDSQAIGDAVPQPPVCSVPPAADETRATDESDEQEESDSGNATLIAAAVVIQPPALDAQAKPNLNTEATAKGVVDVVVETGDADLPQETPPQAIEIPIDELSEGEAANVSAAPFDSVHEADVVATAPATSAVVDYGEVRTASATVTEVVPAISDTPAEETASAKDAADGVATEHHSTRHAESRHHHRQQQSSQREPQTDSASDDDATTAALAAGQTVEVTTPAKRAASRTRESEKHDAIGVGDVAKVNAADAPSETTALSSAEKPAPSALITSIAAEAAETKPHAAVEFPAVRAEPGAVLGAPPATAERLGTMLAQRRVKISASGQGPALTESQQARLVQRVARAFDTARMRGEAEIRLRLSPPELGALKLEVRMESGVMTARLEVETVAAQQALAENLGTLRQRLAEQNIRVEQFDIDLMDRHNGNPSDSPTSQSNHDDRQSPRTPATQRSSQPVGSVAEPRIAARASGGLDVLI